MEVCPLCAEADGITTSLSPDGVTMLTCENPMHAPRTWAKYVEPEGLPSREGIGEELGVYEDLLAVLSRDEPFVEYGVVEHRYALANPDAYRELVDNYGHTALAPSKYTASAFLAKALGTLSHEGAVLFRSVPATGRWSYNGSISGWALPGTGAEDRDEVLSWAEFAQAQGIDPGTWPVLTGGTAG